MPKAFSEREKEVIHEKLLEKGKQLFEVYGLKKTTVEELARAAGISKGAFYLFYPSKEALFLEIIERFEARFRDDLLASLNAPGRSAQENFEALLKKAFFTWKENPILHQFTADQYEILMRTLPENQIQAHFQSDERFVADLLSQLSGAGADLHHAPKTIAGLMKALFFVTLHEAEIGSEYPQVMDMLVESISTYLFAQSGKRS